MQRARSLATCAFFPTADQHYGRGGGSTQCRDCRRECGCDESEGACSELLLEMTHKCVERITEAEFSGWRCPGFLSLQGEGVYFLCYCARLCTRTHTHARTQAPFFLRLSSASWAVSARNRAPLCVRSARPTQSAATLLLHTAELHRHHCCCTRRCRSAFMTQSKTL